MTDYRRVKWIEVAGGTEVLELVADENGICKFIIHKWHLEPNYVADKPPVAFWAPVFWSGLYADAASAERDGMLHLGLQRTARLSGMTTNERLSDAGLLLEWKQACHAKDRDRMAAILNTVDLQEHAGKIIETILADPEVYGF